MANLNYQALEVKDFSGGMTDYFLQGSPTRYQKADNLVVNLDKQLESRDGSVGFDTLGNHKLPGAVRRIDKLVIFRNEDDLLVNQARTVSYLNATPLWTPITGPSGNEALSGGESYASLSSSEVGEHLYLVNDSLCFPSKIYKDENSVYQVRTLGLHIPTSTPTYTDSSLLLNCILLANEIREKMISHIEDTSLHPGFIPGITDKYSLSYLKTETFAGTEPEIPNPIPTPAPNASNEATLYTLIQALCLAYNHHGYDVVNQYYHSSAFINVKGPYQVILSDNIPETLEEAAETLDELRMKWNWHRLGLYSHSATNDYSVMNQYPLLVPPIGVVDLVGVPSITSNYTDYYRYVNYLKNAYNQHVSNGVIGADWDTSLTFNYIHKQKQIASQYTVCTIPDADSLETAYLMTYYIWALYGKVHIPDAENTYAVVTFDAVNGSANVTNVLNSSGGALTLPVNSYVNFGTTPFFTDADPNNQATAQVLSSASGTATLSKTWALPTASNYTLIYSNSVYHSTNSATGAAAITLTSDEYIDPGPSAGLSGINTQLPSSTAAWILMAQQTFQALFAHSNELLNHLTQVDFSGFTTGNGPFFLPEINSYNYAFVYADTYNTESGVEFQVRSAPTFVGPTETGAVYPVGTVLDSGIPGFETNEDSYPNLDTKVSTLSSISISNIPVLVNDTLTNYETATLEVEIYRTINFGNTYYLVDSVTNGVTSYTDMVADTTSSPGVPSLDSRALLYTTGGEVEHTQPPQCKFLHILNQTGYFGYINDGGEIFKNRIIQSIPGVIDGAPLNFFDELDDEISGISSTGSNVVAFCTRSVNRMVGGFDLKGQGALDHIKIADAIGCISSNSIIQTEVGIFFAGTDGFYQTDGFQLIKISVDQDVSYAYLTQTEEQRKRISGTYDTTNRRIWWTMQTNATDVDCDISYVFHLNYGIKPSGVFTTASNENNFRPSALAFFHEEMIRGDMRGLLFKHSSQYRSDPKVPTDLTTPLAQWQTVHIPWVYASCALDFGTIYQGQWVSKIHLMGENKGNVAVQINGIADNINTPSGKKPLSPINYTDNLTWGDATANWGDEACWWRYDGKVDYRRPFPHGNLRSQLKQVEFSPAYVGVYNYDSFPEFSFANVDSTAKTATILTPSAYTDIVWPLDVVDMYIAFEGDNYVQEFLITAVADEVITFSDTDNLSVTESSQKWVIRGYRKETGFSILSYALQFASLGQRGRAYPGSTGRGENAS